MAIALEFIDLVVPVSIIEKKYPGGWERCLLDHAELIGGAVWYDENLFRDGAMNPLDIESLVEQWGKLGMEPTDLRDGMRVWKDVCVVESMSGGPTLPCDWLTFDPDERIAFLTGTEPGAVIGSGNVGGREP